MARTNKSAVLYDDVYDDDDDDDDAIQMTFRCTILGLMIALTRHEVK